MSRPSVPVHYLRPNHAENTPTDVLVFDTETSWDTDDLGEQHHLRLWVACHDRRNDQRVHKPGTTWANGTTVGELVDLIEHHARSGTALWVFAHNLSFDLAVAPLPTELCERGWTLTEFSARSDHPWFRFVRGNHRITMVDSHSWVPTSLEQLAESSTLDKPPLPEPGDSPEQWLHRCTADVALTREAVHQVLHWWEAEQLGRWTISGPACGWNAWRHRFYTHPLLVDPDPKLRAFERRALYGGRREAFRVGCSPSGLYADVDFERAYPTVAGDVLLPVHRLGIGRELRDEDPIWDDPERDLIGRCTVTTDTAAVPCRIDGAVFYPRGTFRTVLTGPEIAYARSRGAHVAVHAHVQYRLAPLLHSWSQWVTSTGPEPDVPWPPAVRFLLKHWSRTVIGRFAARSSQTERFGEAPEPGWHLEPGWHVDKQAGMSWVDVAGTRWLVTHDTEPDNALPAVTAFVEAHCRILLDQLISELGTANVVQCDTDGVLVQLLGPDGPWNPIACRQRYGPPGMPSRSWLAEVLPERIGPLAVHLKAAYRHVDVLGPAQLWRDGERSVSGMPRKAVEHDDGSFSARVWPKLGYQLQNAPDATYVRPTQRYEVKGPYGARWVLADGRTAAPWTTVEGTNTVLERWTPEDTAEWLCEPAGRQIPALERAGGQAVHRVSA